MSGTVHLEFLALTYFSLSFHVFQIINVLNDHQYYHSIKKLIYYFIVTNYTSKLTSILVYFYGAVINLITTKPNRSKLTLFLTC